MNCLMCKSRLEDKATTFMVDLETCIVIVKNVPSQVCDQCGEVSYSDVVARCLEKIVTIQFFIERRGLHPKSPLARG
jgi:YgiT-type zinc finger domain-containing protein